MPNLLGLSAYCAQLDFQACGLLHKAAAYSSKVVSLLLGICS